MMGGRKTSFILTHAKKRDHTSTQQPPLLYPQNAPLTQEHGGGVH
jgi:hypothetical protein